jgi:DNA-binding response OmpR family regulator
MGPVSVLAVTPADDDQVLLEHVFSHSNWRLDRVRTCREALEFLGRTEVSVIICAAALPDASWKELLNEVKQQPAPPRVIVSSPIADDSLWAEVLDMGGYDVLGKPFDQREVIRVVSLAWRQWKHEREQAGRDADDPAAASADHRRGAGRSA